MELSTISWIYIGPLDSHLSPSLHVLLCPGLFLINDVRFPNADFFPAEI